MEELLSSDSKRGFMSWLNEPFESFLPLYRKIKSDSAANNSRFLRCWRNFEEFIVMHGFFIPGIDILIGENQLLSKHFATSVKGGSHRAFKHLMNSKVKMDIASLNKENDWTTAINFYSKRSTIILLIDPAGNISEFTEDILRDYTKTIGTNTPKLVPTESI